MERRRFLRIMALGALGSMASYAARYFFDKARQPKQTIPKAADVKESDLEVKHFNKQILRKVALKTEPDLNHLFYPAVASYSFISLWEYRKEIKNNFKARAAITSLATMARAADIESTVQGVSAFDDERFIKYGFNELFFEKTPLMNVHPAKDQLRKKGYPTVLIQALGTWFFPFFAGPYLPGIFLIYKNNAAIDDIVKDGYDLGDQVNLLIQEKKSRKEIIDYISSYQKT